VLIKSFLRSGGSARADRGGADRRRACFAFRRGLAGVPVHLNAADRPSCRRRVDRTIDLVCRRRAATLLIPKTSAGHAYKPDETARR
jgi:hypothetical protein